jgi:adenylate cyclase
VCSAAGPGEVVISASTRARIGERETRLQRLPPVDAKGKEEPLEVWRVDWQRATD